MIDYGCGVGYGAAMLAANGLNVVAIDRSSEALDFARKHWNRAGLQYVLADLSRSEASAAPPADAAVAFEVIEHLQDPLPFLRGICAGTLFASVPNEDVFPWRNYKFHWRHYTREQFEELLNAAGWHVHEWHGQLGPESPVEPNVDGHTLVAVCKRKPLVADGYRHPTGTTPATVMLCGLGPSKYELTELMLQHDYEPYWDELWTVNKGIAMFPRADVAFIMDDVYDYADRHPAYGKEMQRFGGKIIGQTTIRNDDSIRFREFPLAQLLEHWGGSAANWLHTISLGYILGYAGMIGVKRLLLAGIDCSWPNRPDLSEAGNAVVCYWIGRLESVGVEVIINSDSALNGTNQRNRYGYRKFYGYLKQPRL